MKPFIFLLTLFAFSSCSTEVQKIETIDPKAIALNDSAVKLWMTFKPGSLDSAHILLDKSIAIEPDYFIAYGNKVNIYRHQRNFVKAAETARHLERIQPQNAEGIFGLGFLLEKIGKREESEEKYKRALSLNEKKLKDLDLKDKTYLAIQTNYALNLIFAHREEEGRQELDKVLAIDPNQPGAKMLHNKSRNEIMETLLIGKN